MLLGRGWLLVCEKDIGLLLFDGNLGVFIIIIGDSSGVFVDIYDCMLVWLQVGQIDEWMVVSFDDVMVMLFVNELLVMEVYCVSCVVNMFWNNCEDLLQLVE